MRIAVIDGQGGGIGKTLVEKIRKEFADDVEIWAFGTNALATSLMVKAGADDGASGESAIRHSVDKVDMIIGSISIIVANSMLGELTPGMAEAIASCHAPKILLPLNRCNVHIIGKQQEPLPHMAAELIKQLKIIYNERLKFNVRS